MGQLPSWIKKNLQQNVNVNPMLTPIIKTPIDPAQQYTKQINDTRN